MTQSKSSTALPAHHRARTFFAAVFGTIALSLVFTSLLTVWLQRTLTDTPTYVQTVAPLVKQPAVQDFVSQKAANQLLEAAPTADLAGQLLPPADVAGKTEEQLRAALRPVLVADFKEIVASDEFAELWKNTNESAHSQFTSQVQSGATTMTLDLSPAVTGAIAQLKASKLKVLGDNLEFPAGAGRFEIKNDTIGKIHDYYNWLQKGTITLVVVTIICIGLAVLLSVHHNKTLRRILIGSGSVMLIMAAALQAPQIINLQGADAATFGLAIAVAAVLLHNLQLACLWIGVGCISVAIASKIAERTRAKGARI